METPDKLHQQHLRSTPAVGMGATLCQWTDRWPCTVIKVTPRTIVVREDRAIRTDDYGMSETQVWEITPDPDGDLHTFSLRKKSGQWVERGFDTGSGAILRLGTRSRYHDFSF